MPLSTTHQLARVVMSEGEGGRWVVDIAALDGSIEDDLGRRDFTIDALALPLASWGAEEWKSSIIDPFGGIEDLGRGAIRATRASVFKDDPARLLRAVRLAAKLGFAIEPRTRQFIVEQASLVGSVAAERIRDELLAIVALKEAKIHLALLDELGLLCATIPELEQTKGVSQPKEHYWDVFDHSLESVGRAERVTEDTKHSPVPSLVPWDEQAQQHFGQEVGDGHSRRTLLKVAALLHDIAKPQTKMIDSSGRTRFFVHHTMGAAMTSTVLRRLRFSAKSTSLVCSMVQHHLRPGQMSQGVDLPTGRAIYRFFRDVGDAAVDTLYLSLADYLAARGPELDVLDWKRRVGMVAHVLKIGTAQDRSLHQVPLINGHDIMEEEMLEPGPLVGSLLEGAREAEAAGEIHTREEALAWVSSTLECRNGKSAVPLPTVGSSDQASKTRRE